MTHPTSWETLQTAGLNVAVRNPSGSKGTAPNHSLLSVIEKYDFQPHNILDANVAFCTTVWNFLMSVKSQLVMVKLPVLSIQRLTLYRCSIAESKLVQGS